MAGRSEQSRQVRELARRLYAIERSRTAGSTPQLPHTSLDDAAILDKDREGNVMGRIGRQPDGSHTHEVLDGPVPYTPTAPACVPGALSVEVAWDGSLVDGPEPRVDFAACEVLRDGELVGSIPARSGGAVEVSAPAGECVVTLRIRSQAGRYGAVSEPVSVTVPPLVDPAQFEDAREDLDEARGRISDARDRLDVAFGPGQSYDVAEALGRKGATYTGDTPPAPDPAGLWLRGADRTPHVYVDYEDPAADQWRNRAPGLAAWELIDNGGSATYADGVITLKNGGQARSPVMTIPDDDDWRFSYLVAVEGENPRPGDPRSVHMISYYTDAAGEPVENRDGYMQNGHAGGTGSAEWEQVVYARVGGPGLVGVQILHRSGTVYAPPTVVLREPGLWTQSEGWPVEAGYPDGDAPGWVWDGDRWASTSRYAGPGWYDASDLAAQRAGLTALARADAAQDAADVAQARADAARADAAAAQGAADAAQATADDAADAAATANSEALAAAGLAESRGEVIYQASAPTGSRAHPANLWIRTSDARPHTYDGSSWVRVTDQAALDAASAAAGAQQSADDAADAAAAAASAAATAQQAADTAQDTADRAEGKADQAQAGADTALARADTALASADGKTATTYSEVPDDGTPGPVPPGDGVTAGDVHRNRIAGGTVVAEWEWDGSAWAPVDYGDQVLRSLELGKLVAGAAALDDVVAQRVAAASGQYIDLDVEQLTVTGDTVLDQAVAQFLGAQTGEFVELAAKQIATGTLGAEVSVTVPATDTDWMVMGRPAEGLAYLVPGAETEEGAPDEPPVTVMRMGRSVAVLDETTGETLAMLDEAGDLTAGQASVASLSVAGDDVGDLLDTRGGYEVSAAFPNDHVGPFIGEFGYVELDQFVARAGRSYQVHAVARVRGASGASQYLVRFRRNQSDASVDAASPTINSTILGEDNTGALSGSIIETVAHTAKYYSGPDQDRHVRILLTGAGLGSGDTALSFVAADVMVTDTGPAAPRNGRYSRGGGGRALPSDPLPPPDEEPPKQTHTVERFAGWQACYTQYGRAASRYGLRQGQGGSSRYVAVLGIPDQVRSDLAGVPASAIDYVDVRLSYAEPALTRRARIGVSSRSSASPSDAPLVTQVVSEDFRPGQTRWVRLPRSTYADIASGSTKSITMGDSMVTGQDLMNFYTLSNSTSLRPRIRYRYTK